MAGLRSERLNTCCSPSTFCAQYLWRQKHGTTLFPHRRAGAVNTMGWGLTGVQTWHKGRDVIRLRTSLSAYYFMYKKVNL